MQIICKWWWRQSVLDFTWKIVTNSNQIIRDTKEQSGGKNRSFNCKWNLGCNQQSTFKNFELIKFPWLKMSRQTQRIPLKKWVSIFFVVQWILQVERETTSAFARRVSKKRDTIEPILLLNLRMHQLRALRLF